MRCDDCGRVEGDGHMVYECEECHKHVCSDCSENDPRNGMTVLCLDCEERITHEVAP